jgi:MFS family permease
MAGPVLAGLLFYRFGWQYPFLLAAAVTLVCSGIVLSMRGPQKEADAPPDPGSGSDAPPHAERWLRMAWYANFASWFIGGVVRALFPKIGHDLKYTEEISGYVIGCLSLAQMAMFAALRFTTRWQFRLMPLIGAQLVGVLGMVLALFAPGPIVFGLGFLLAGISTGVTYSCSQFYSLHGRQSGRAATAGLHEAILGSGAIFGPLLGGLAARFVSLRAPFAVAGLVILVAMALELLELRGMRAGGGTPLKWRGTPAEQADSVATPGGTT